MNESNVIRLKIKWNKTQLKVENGKRGGNELARSYGRFKWKGINSLIWSLFIRIAMVIWFSILQNTSLSRMTPWGQICFIKGKERKNKMKSRREDEDDGLELDEWINEKNWCSFLQIHPYVSEQLELLMAWENVYNKIKKKHYCMWLMILFLAIAFHSIAPHWIYELQLKTICKGLWW